MNATLSVASHQQQQHAPHQSSTPVTISNSAMVQLRYDVPPFVPSQPPVQNARFVQHNHELQAQQQSQQQQQGQPLASLLQAPLNMSETRAGIGNRLYNRIYHMRTTLYAPRITSMLLELPTSELARIWLDENEFKRYVDTALEIILMHEMPGHGSQMFVQGRHPSGGGSVPAVIVSSPPPQQQQQPQQLQSGSSPLVIEVFPHSSSSQQQQQQHQQASQPVIAGNNVTGDNSTGNVSQDVSLEVLVDNTANSGPGK